MRDKPEPRTSPSTAPGTPNVTWDDSNMRSLYSNVCNVTGTREEIVLLFGVHQARRTEMTWTAMNNLLRTRTLASNGELECASMEPPVAGRNVGRP